MWLLLEMISWLDCMYNVTSYRRETEHINSLFQYFFANIDSWSYDTWLWVCHLWFNLVLWPFSSTETQCYFFLHAVVFGGTVLASLKTWIKPSILTVHYSLVSYWAVLSCGCLCFVIKCGSNFLVCGSNHVVWPFFGKLLNSTFMWCCLFCDTVWF